MAGAAQPRILAADFSKLLSGKGQHFAPAVVVVWFFFVPFSPKSLHHEPTPRRDTILNRRAETKQPAFHSHKTNSEGDGTARGSSLWISDRLRAGATS